MPILDRVTERSFSSAGLPVYHGGGDITAPLLYSNFAAQKHIKVPVFFVSVLSELEQSHTRKPGMVSF